MAIILLLHEFWVCFELKVDEEKEDEAKLNAQPVVNNVTLWISRLPNDLNIFITILTIIIKIYHNIITSIIILIMCITIS